MTALFQQGAQVGGARIVRVIGSGEVATVYEALHEGALRALKIIEVGVVEGGATKEGESTTAQRRGALEGEAIAMIEHVNVVRWFDSGIIDGRVWILLELVNGSNLHQLRVAAGGRLPAERVVSLARQACEGLVAVHKKKIIHRDLKPENILVTRDDIAKIADFGNAKLPGWGVKTTTALRRSAMAYMAPEVWLGNVDPDPRSDVYAMGLIIYEMITGTNPTVPQFLNMLETCKRHLHYEPPPLVSVVDKPEELSELSALLQRAMAKDLAQRCTMRELADGLEEVQDRLLVWRRAAARSLPLPNQHPALALTAPMPAIPNPNPESSTPAPTSAPAPVVSHRGTIVMQAAPAPSEETRDTDRNAAPPPPPLPLDPAGVPSTLRTPSHSQPAPLAIASEPDMMRRSTGIPVESTARPSAPRTRVARVAVALFAGLMTLAAVAWWTLSSREQVPRVAPAVAPPITSASSPPAASIVKPPSSASSTPGRSPRRMPPSVPPHR